MRIPENRIYKVRSTARQAARIADPNLGAGPAALARGMAPAIQGAIAATGQRIRNTLEEARNPHWLTHLKLAQTIAQTGAQVSRDLATAYERRLAHGLEEDLANLAKSRNEFFSGAGTDDLATLDAFNAAYNESDYYRGLSGERRARLDAVRDREREKYAEREIDKAIDRRRRVRAMEVDAKFMEHIDGQFRDHPDENGNVVAGLVNTRWTRGTDGTDSDGPVKRLVDLDKSFDETDYAKSMTAEERASFEERRPRLLSQYMREAEAAQQRQMKAEREKAVRDYGTELANNVDAAIMARPGEQAMINFGEAVDELARFAADQMVPGEEETVWDEDGNEVHSPSWNKAYRDATQAQWARRFGVITGAFEVAPDLTADDKQKAAELEGAIRGTLAAIDAGGGMYTEEERLAAHAAWEASRMKRIANIEAGYQRAERDVETAATAFSLVRPGEAGKADRDALDANAAAALERLPQGPRREAAVRAYNEAKDTIVAQSFLNSGLFQTYLAGPPQSRREDTTARRNAYNDAKAAYDGLTDSQRMAMNRILDAQRDAQMKRETDMAKKVSGWASGGMSAMDMARNLNQKFASGVISAAEHDAGMREARKAAAYENVFKDNPDARKAHDAMVMRSVRKLFAGFGDGAVERLFKWDKNGFLVYNDDGTPALADGVARTARFTAMHNGTFYTTRERGIESNWPNYVDVSAATVAEAASVAREYITQFYMGGVAGSKNGMVSQSDLDEYMVSMIGDKASRASDEAMSATAMSIIGTVPALVSGGVDFMSASRMASDRSGDAAEKRQKKEDKE